MESHPAQPAAFFVGSPCRREPTCPYLRRGRCLFFHSEDETASASLVRQDQPPVGSVMARLARLERVVEQILATSMPQITTAVEQTDDGVQAVPQERDQPGDQARRVSTDAVHRQVAVSPVVMQRQVPLLKIKHATKHVEILQQYIDKVAVEIPLNLHVDDTVVDMPLVIQRQVLRIQTADSPPINQVIKHAEFPQNLHINKVVDRSLGFRRWQRRRKSRPCLSSEKLWTCLRPRRSSR